MNWHIHHHLHAAPEADRVIALLEALLTQYKDLMTSIADLKTQADKTLAAVARGTTIDQSLITLVQGMTAQLADLKAQLAAAIQSNDPAALQEVLDQMTAAETTATANAQAVVDAVKANTPADPNAAPPATETVPGSAPAGTQNTGTTGTTNPTDTASGQGGGL